MCTCVRTRVRAGVLARVRTNERTYVHVVRPIFRRWGLILFLLPVLLRDPTPNSLLINTCRLDQQRIPL